jgi:hypothetical protein
MIFKQASCADEIFEEMQNVQNENLVKEASHNDLLVIKAMEELNLAAQYFDKIGQTKHAIEITKLFSLLDNNV